MKEKLEWLEKIVNGIALTVSGISFVGMVGLISINVFSRYIFKQWIQSKCAAHIARP